MAESRGDEAYRRGFSSIEAMVRYDKVQGRRTSLQAESQAKRAEWENQGGTERNGSRYLPSSMNHEYPRPPLQPKSTAELKDLIISRRQAGLDIRPQMIEYGKLIGITTMDRAQELSNIVKSWK